MMSWMASDVVPWPPMSGVCICGRRSKLSAHQGATNTGSLPCRRPRAAHCRSWLAGAGTATRRAVVPAKAQKPYPTWYHPPLGGSRKCQVTISSLSDITPAQPGLEDGFWGGRGGRGGEKRSLTFSLSMDAKTALRMEVA